MRNEAPHPWVRHRKWLLVLAIAAWVVAFVVLLLFKGSSVFPTSKVVGVSAIVFAWSNGAFWWVELRYPHIEVGPNRYESRADRASDFMYEYLRVFFLFYWLFATGATVAAVRLMSEKDAQNESGRAPNKSLQRTLDPVAGLLPQTVACVQCR